MAYLEERHANYARSFRFFIIGLCIVAAFTAGLLYVRHIQTRRISDNVAQLSRSAKILNGSERFQRNFRRMAGGLRDYLSTGKVTSRHIYEEAVADNNKILHELRTAVPEGSEQKILLDDIRELQQYWIDEVASPLLKVREAIVDEQGERYVQELYKQKQVRKLEVDVGLSLQRKFSDLLVHSREAYLSGPAK